MDKKCYEGLTQNRKNFVEQISYLIVNELTEVEKVKEYNSDESINTIAIDSSFGMGKTFFSKGLTHYLKEEALKNSSLENLEVINYDAWKSDFFQDPMKTILYKILSSVDSGAKVEMELKETGRKVLKTCGKSVDELTKIPVFKILSILKNSDKIDSLEEYEGYLNLIEKTKEILEEESIFFNDGYSSKVIIIDELDRCRPDFSIEVLEAVKHFFNIRGLFFVFLVNKEQLTKSAENLFGSFCGKESYFQKFFDLEFKLPELDFQEYIGIEYKNHADNSNYLKKVEGVYEVDINIFSEVLFLYLYKNLEKSFGSSVREFKKKFSKFKMLIKTLNSKEQEEFTLIFALTLFYLKKEFKENIDMVEYLDGIRSSFSGSEIENNAEVYYEKSIEIFEESFLRVELSGEYIHMFFKLMDGFKFKERGSQGFGVELFAVGMSSTRNAKKVMIENKKIENLKCDFEGLAFWLPLKESVVKNKNGSEILLDWCKKKYSFLEALYEHE